MITYEMAQETDAQQIKQIYELTGWGSKDDPLDLIIKIIQGSFCFYVAKENGRLIGIARAISDGVSDAYIQDVTVIENFRGRGIGYHLINLIKEFLLKSGISWIGVISEPGAENFYPKFGFNVMKGYTPFLLGDNKWAGLKSNKNDTI